jgi:hypothetical protein
MPIVILIVLLLVVLVLPSYWVNSVMRRYHNPPDR